MENNTISLQLTNEELAELSKMVYLAQYIVDCSDDVYPHLKTFNSAQRKIHQLAVQTIPGMGLSEIDEMSEDRFTYTLKMEEECEPILDAYNTECYYDKIATELANRDFEERHGKLSAEMFFTVKALHDEYFEIQEEYQDELQENSLSRLRLSK